MPQARFLLDILGHSLNEDELRNGLRIEVGWSVVTLRQVDVDLFELYEPDFYSDPFTQLRADVTTTLAVIARQSDFMREVSAPAVPVRFDQKIIASSGSLALEHVYLERSDPATNDSGWYIGPVDEKGEELEGLYVYQLLESRPEFLPVLLLPPRYLVTFSGSDVESVVDENNREIWQER